MGLNQFKDDWRVGTNWYIAGRIFNSLTDGVRTIITIVLRGFVFLVGYIIVDFTCSNPSKKRQYIERLKGFFHRGGPGWLSAGKSVSTGNPSIRPTPACKGFIEMYNQELITTPAGGVLQAGLWNAISYGSDVTMNLSQIDPTPHNIAILNNRYVKSIVTGELAVGQTVDQKMLDWYSGYMTEENVKRIKDAFSRTEQGD